MLTTDTSTGKGPRQRQPWLWLLIAVWLATAVSGLRIVWVYDNTPGVLARAPQRWPAASALTRTMGEPALVVLAHPQCPCTRASLGELAEVLARAPPSRRRRTCCSCARRRSPAGWEQTALWRPRSSLPGRHRAARRRWRGGATVRRGDIRPDAALRRRGRCAFSGGITGARGPRRRQRRARVARGADCETAGRPTTRHERLRLPAVRAGS